MHKARLTLDSPQFADSLRVYRRASFETEFGVGLIQDFVSVKQSKAHVKKTISRPRLSHQVEFKKRAIYDVVPRTNIVRVEPKTDIPPQVTEATTRRKEEKPKNKVQKPIVFLYSLAALLLVCGGYITFTGFKNNKQVLTQARNVASAQSVATDEAGTAATDVPTDEKPSEATVKNYVVSPTMPRYITISKLGIHARAIPLSVDKNNQLRAPRNGYDVGWYNASSLPGENGAMVMDAHSNVLGKAAVFAKLKKLEPEDKISITRGDGREFIYTVKTVETVDDEKVNMANLLVSIDTNKPGLSLITCAGDVIPGTLHLDKRTLVRAVIE